MRLKGHLATVAELTDDQRDRMFALMEAHYENVCRTRFDADLAEKRWVIQVLDPDTGELLGFSTQMLLHVVAGGRPIEALFSGDTIIDRAHWGDPVLAHVWGRLVLTLLDARPRSEFYWFLISKGYKTYRYLPLFFREFYPRQETPMPPRAREVLDALARHKFGAAYDPAAGLVRGNGGKDRLRAGVADVTAERLRDPHVRFFVERNPGHAHGNELCCLAPLSRPNFTPAAWRVIGPEPGPVPAGALG